MRSSLTQIYNAMNLGNSESLSLARGYLAWIYFCVIFLDKRLGFHLVCGSFPKLWQFYSKTTVAVVFQNCWIRNYKNGSLWQFILCPLMTSKWSKKGLRHIYPSFLQFYYGSCWPWNCKTIIVINGVDPPPSMIWLYKISKDSSPSIFQGTGIPGTWTQ